MIWRRRRDAYRHRVHFESQLEAAERRWVKEADVPETPVPHPGLLALMSGVFAVGFWALAIGTVVGWGQGQALGVAMMVTSGFVLWRFFLDHLAEYRVAYQEGVVDLPWQSDPTDAEEPF